MIDLDVALPSPRSLRRLAGTGALAVVTVGVGVAPAPAQEEPPSEAEMVEMRERMMKAAVPGPEHERLAELAGKWALETRIQPSHGADPETFEGVAEGRMILGGRFLALESRAGEGAMATEALTVVGFDRRSDVYTTVGFDTWGTYYVTGEGPFDSARDAAVMSGTDDDPITGRIQVYDFVLRFDGPDRFVWEVVFHDEAHTGGQGPLTMVRSTYTRP